MRKSAAGVNTRRGRRLDDAPLDYEPENELGVVFLFSDLAKREYGLRIERIRPGFPDCIAYQGEKRVRTEFEYRSRNFKGQGHNSRQCDWLVCWIHDWPAVPKRMRVVELRKEYGLGFNVWVVGVRGSWRETLDEISYSERWSVPARASEGDLVLYYSTAPDSCIRNIFRLAGRVAYARARWKSGMDWFAPIRRVCSLKCPVHLEELRNDPIAGRAGFVRASMLGRNRVTPHWPRLLAIILDRNPGLKRIFAKYGPERIA